MVGVDMKGLIDKCNSVCVQIMHAAAGLTVNRSNYEVAVEHFFAAALEDKNCDFYQIITAFGVDESALKQELNKSLENFRSGNSGRPVFSPLLQDLLESAWLESSVNRGFSHIRTGTLLAAFLRRSSYYAQGAYGTALAAVSREALDAQFARLTEKSSENAAEQELAPASRESGGAATAGAQGESFIARFCEDFTVKAKNGNLDPVFGRDAEIRQMVDILARRRKNNPILVGDPGVGKTAVMEGLALRISLGDVPPTLQGVSLLSLDMGLLEAGASVKGEFERRLKGVLDEIKASPTPIILFIDEAHLLVGAGANAGGGDAANLMKPALARGEIRTCAATTWKEYKKYFEKDAALARRFQLVKLEEPSVDTAALILRGLRSSYEKAHGVLVRDDALVAAAELSDRYIQGRFLPDKAVDLLDTACARVKINLVATPAPLEDCRRAIQARERELQGLERDEANGSPIDKEHVAHLQADIAAQEAQAAELSDAWQAELAAAQAFIAARGELIAAKEKQAEDQQGDAVTAASERLQAARLALAAQQQNGAMIGVEVSPDVIAQVVSDWTGIPVGKMARDQASGVLLLQDTLQARVRGQDMALKSIVEGIEAAKAGLRSPEQPMGVFLLVGPSGVGKTETALSLAEAIFGDEKSLITVNMSEFQEKHSVSRLIGSPPGYVGYGEGGMLSEAVRRRPYSVVLLDECEKAHLDVMQVFYQVFDKGILTDGEGTEVDFSNTLILLASNLASELIQELTAGEDDDDEVSDYSTVAAAIRPALSKHFQPALLARMQIVPYVSLRAEALTGIAVLKLSKIRHRLLNNNHMEMRWSDAVVNKIVDRCREVETGARNIDAVISSAILPSMARRILERMSGANMPAAVTLDVDEAGGFVIAFDEGVALSAPQEGEKP